MKDYLKILGLALALVFAGSVANAFVLEDPRTRIGANVSNDGHLEVTAIIQSGIEHSSDKDGLAFSWGSTYSATAADEIIAITNDDNDRKLHIVHIEVGGASASLFTLFEVTSGVLAGTTITAQNLNLDSGKVAEETSFGNAALTNALTGNTLAVLHVQASSTKTISLQSALILAKNDSIAITVGSNSVIAVTIYGFYDE